MLLWLILACVSQGLVGIAACGSTDGDLDGYTVQEGDCDDANPAVYPGAVEVCDGIDNDCDGKVDTPTTQMYLDGDGDGFGANQVTVDCHGAPVAYVAQGGDCNDGDAAVNPGAVERCDGRDNDCDGTIDDGARGYFRDADGDGFGRSDDRRCDAAPGYVTARGDCNDADAAIHPGAADAPSDGIDSDCGGTAAADPHVGFGAGSYSSIQAAILDAPPGATVWVAPGTYLEHDIDFQGRAVALVSTGLAGATVIDAGQKGRVMLFTSGETSSTRVDGFTLTRGRSDYNVDHQGYGAGIYLSNSSPTLSDCDFLANDAIGYLVSKPFLAGWGGGMYLSGSSPTITRCRFLNNSATASGGGLYLDHSDPSLTDCTLERNRAGWESDGEGGGIAALSSSPTMTRCLLSANTASHLGGGMYLWLSEAILSDCTFAANLAGGVGGGLVLSSSSPTMTRCVLSGNLTYNIDVTLPPTSGGGMAFSDSSPTMVDCTLTGNSADYCGGIDAGSSSPILRHCLIARNVAKGVAGIGLDSGNGILENCALVGNTALESNGGALVLAQASPSVTRCVITGNSAVLGGGIYATYTQSNPVLENLILAYNTGYNLYADASASSVLIRWSDLYAPAGPNHNLATLDPSNLLVEPEFLSYDGGGMPLDLHLASGSVLIDAGNPAIVDPDGSRSDPGWFGGPEGGLTDLDGDGFPSWFWPGAISDAPAGFDPADFDRDDLDASLH